MEIDQHCVDRYRQRVSSKASIDEIVTLVNESRPATAEETFLIRASSPRFPLRLTVSNKIDDASYLIHDKKWLAFLVIDTAVVTVFECLYLKHCLPSAAPSMPAIDEKDSIWQRNMYDGFKQGHLVYYCKGGKKQIELCKKHGIIYFRRLGSCDDWQLMGKARYYQMVKFKSSTVGGAS